MHRVLRPGGTAVVVDVDPPTTFAGRLCAWSGYVLFRQDEIRENIRGVLREAFDQSPFRQWRPIEHYSGYITTFLLRT
jgi:ubiquinone/menaquinone biosynthesis C-methylase UbiE